MKIHWLQHVSFEGLGCIESWLAENGHDVSCTRLWAYDSFPATDRIDGLIVMGGPMGVYDEAIYPWLAEETAFIKQLIAQDKPVLGICLGAQLIAEVLGAGVWQNSQREIGFFECRASVPLALNDRDGRSTFFGKAGKLFPETFTAFHWHGDTFGIPDGAVHLASSAACENQAFIYKDRVLALQFHLETTEESLLSLYKNCAGEITVGPFIQKREEADSFLSNLRNANELMSGLLARLFS
jgi:GMP synthase (glutamine-hydrolysing)